MAQRELWVGTSWKMNKGPAEARAAAHALAQINLPPHVNTFVVPPFTSLNEVAQILKESPMLVGAQNMHWEDAGAWTGEISPVMIRECGARLVEIGHSERREHFGETDHTVNLKVKAAIKHGLRPLICIGDSAQDFAFEVTTETLARQLKIALSGLKASEISDVLIAYEPVWAIGAKGKAAEPDFVQHIQAKLRASLAEMTDAATAEKTCILYGGSVSKANAQAYVSQPDIDGVFIGRAAWDPKDFSEIVDLVAQ